jgi:hypothetical protein
MLGALCVAAQPPKSSAPSTSASAPASKPAAPPVDLSSRPRLNDDQRRLLIREFEADLVFIHTVFPMGKTGLTISPDGKVNPPEEEVRQTAMRIGAAAKPGDRARITDVRFLRNSIVFEINGGPVKKKKWYQRIEVGGAQGSVRPADQSSDSDPLYVNSNGSYVMVEFKNYVPAITADELKAKLLPVFDFKAMTMAEAYLKALPPKLQDAVTNHRALVGMDREMVMYAMGRPPRRHRETEGETEYEEWIFGEPPKDVQFIRFVGDKVIRIVIMKVDGEKIVREEDELADIRAELAAQKDEQAKKAEEQQATTRRTAPSLVQPGEVSPEQKEGGRPKQPAPSMPLPPPP